MTDYEKKCEECASHGLRVIEMHLTKAEGLLYKRIIAIEKSLPDAQKVVVLDEELTHWKVNVGDITDQRKVANRKQERRARKRVYHRFASPHTLIQLYRLGARSVEDFCDRLGITEEFLAEALAYYDEAYGQKTIGRYRISFRPFNIIEEDTHNGLHSIEADQAEERDL